ncbi:MAG: hypothetical protein LC790_04490 [Actinobacteria bacterium]|nr:hypothetical protein [Actinomycetota bacterium]
MATSTPVTGELRLALDEIIVRENVRDIDQEHVENLAQSIALHGLPSRSSPAPPAQSAYSPIMLFSSTVLLWARRVSNLRPLACEATPRQRVAPLFTWKSAESGTARIERDEPDRARYGQDWSHE